MQNLWKIRKNAKSKLLFHQHTLEFTLDTFFHLLFNLPNPQFLHFPKNFPTTFQLIEITIWIFAPKMYVLIKSVQKMNFFAQCHWSLMKWIAQFSIWIFAFSRYEINTLNVYIWYYKVFFEFLGDLKNENSVLEWVLNSDNRELDDAIEAVNMKMLNKLLQSSPFMAVFFCKFYHQTLFSPSDLSTHTVDCL